MSDQKKMVTLDEAKRQVERICRRLALLHLAFSKMIIEECGEEKGKLVVLKAIKEYGRLIGNEALARAAAQNLKNDPSNYKEDLPLYGMNEGSEIVEVDGEPRIRMHGCVLGRVWKELGAERLGRLYCYIDPAKFMAFKPDYKMTHLKSLTDGDDYCEFVLRPTTESDRQDLAADKDWAYIDRG